MADTQIQKKSTMQQKFKIGIICPYSFPVGMAAATRIISYSKGLIQNGADVEVYSYIWRGDDSDEPLEGCIDGMKYVIPCKFHTKKGKLYHFFIDRPNIYGGTIRRIKESHKEKPFDCMLISFDGFHNYRYFLPKIAAMKIPMVYIGDEYPRPIRMLKKKISFWYKIRLKFYHRYFCKRILMTQALANYFNKEISPKPTYILNSVLDETRFKEIVRQPVSKPYLCYMGNMQLKKDNVDNIIKAFSLIADDFPQYYLLLYGTPDSLDRQFIEDCIKQTRMSDRVFIKGRVDYKEVPQILANATILVTSQPNTKRAEGGFPTKMGEYMMSHTPMLVTDVGEIHEYVQDGITTFMVAPENPTAYAEKLRYILNHYDEATRVAENAYNYASTHFSTKDVTKDMLTFLKS